MLRGKITFVLFARTSPVLLQKVRLRSINGSTMEAFNLRDRILARNVELLMHLLIFLLDTERKFTKCKNYDEILIKIVAKNSEN